jgi:hypothetical protein
LIVASEVVRRLDGSPGLGVLQMRQTTFPVSRIAIRNPLDSAGNEFCKLPESERGVFSHLDFYFLILTLSRVSFPGATR